MPKPNGALLHVDGLQAWYGESHILHGVNFDVRPGEVVTLLGRNGAGKTTTLKSIMGIVGKRQGSVRFEDKETIRANSDRIARMGIALLPGRAGDFRKSRRQGKPAPPTASEIPAAFPSSRFSNSSPTSRSGYLARAQSFRAASSRCSRLAASCAPAHAFCFSTNRQKASHPSSSNRSATIARLKDEGFTILLVEQNFRFASTVADRYYVMEHGKIIDAFANSELQANMEKLHQYLGV